jgi:hypothetical protein
MRVLAMAAMVLCSGWAPALTRVRDDHPARASAASAPLPEVATMLTSDAPTAAPPAPEHAGHGHHHHGGAGHE